MKNGIKLFFIALWVMIACSKKEVAEKPEATGNILLQVRHNAGTDSLVLNKVFYSNSAGNQLRFSKLKYFISGLHFYRKGKKVYHREKPFIVHAAYPESNELLLEDVPEGSYDSLQLSIGVVPMYNVDGAIALQPDNYGMYWPEELGGGYHFVKLEGHWRHDTAYGTFAFHIGKNENLIPIRLPFAVKVEAGQTQHWTVVMDVLEWFDNPYRYDLRYEDGYTMGNGSQMGILKKNGHNTISIFHSPFGKNKLP